MYHRSTRKTALLPLSRYGRLGAAALIGLPAGLHAQQVPAVRLTADAAPAAAAPEDGGVEQIVVRARRLSQARSKLQPALGATVYEFGAKALGDITQGSNAPLSTVLLQAPGVSEDSYGQIHVRGDHNEVQYRLDGVELPEGVAVFGQSLETRFAHSIALITGSLPAQYGVLQAAVIDIATKTGLTDPGGAISIYGGSRDNFQPSASFGGHRGDWDLFVTGDLLHTRVGIENPTSSFNPTHDLSNQYHGLAHLTYTPNDEARVSLLAGVSSAQFQIPNNPGQVPGLGLDVGGVSHIDSASLTEHQREITDFGILSLQKHYGNLDVQASLFSRYSSLYFTPDPIGDLLFTGLAQTAAKSVWSSGTQTDATWAVNAAHTIRAGFQITGERLASVTSSNVFFLDAAGRQTSPLPSTLASGSGRTGGVYGLYVQDAWKLLPTVTLNYGGRFDLVDEYTHENQVSPRINIVWQARPDTALHAGYAHYFTPPPFELIPPTVVAQFNGTSGASACPIGTAPQCRDDAVRAEHDNYYDAGIDHTLLPGLHVAVDGYFKSARNLIDEGQFGAPIILTVFNYRTGQVGGVEFASSYERGPWSVYANLAVSRAIGRGIESAQFNFPAATLDYSAHHFIHLDHDARFTGSGGVAFSAWRGTDMPARFSADLVTGSGLRASNGIPNGRALPGYYAINLSASENLRKLFLGGVELRFDVINLLDRKYEIRDGTGVGVGAPQFGLRRTLLAGITQHF